MRRLWFLAVLLLGGSAFAQTPAPSFPALQFLVGDWIADGPPAAGSGHFEFTPDVQGHVLVRRNHADVPAANGRPAGVHDDLMVIYQEGKPHAIYFDNEGHVIRYDVETAAPDTVTFVSEATAGASRFRLSYARLADGRLSGKFEIAPPGQPGEFKAYLEWTAKRR